MGGLGGTIGSSGYAGTQFFTDVFNIIEPASKLIIAIACIGLLLTALRTLISPDDDQVAASATQIRRILIISLFLGMLGFIVSWIFNGMGVTIFGFNMRPGVWNFG